MNPKPFPILKNDLWKLKETRQPTIVRRVTGVIDATYVFSDLPSVIAQLRDEKAWAHNDRNGHYDI
jgi:hypothetical protein